MNVSPSASPYTISSGVINSIANGSAVKFRVTSNGSPCNTQNSNVITQTWNKDAEVSFSINSVDNGSTCYTLNILNGNFTGKIKIIGDAFFKVQSPSVTFSDLFADKSFIIPSDTKYYELIEDITINEGSYNGCILTEGAPVNVGDLVEVYGALWLLDINGNLLTPDIYIESNYSS
jgi:hypothetical protein